MQAQQALEARPVRERRGYVWSFVGGLGGGVVLGGIGALLGLAVGSAQSDTSTDTGYLSGLGEALAPIGYAVLFGFIGLFAGSVLGCWLLLRALKNPLAGRTAAILAIALPVGWLVLAGLDEVMPAEYLSVAFLGFPLIARAVALRSSR